MTLKTDTDQPCIQEKVAGERTRHTQTLNLSVAGRAVLCSIQERKITVMDVSIEAMVASKEEKETSRRREENCTSTTIMNVLVGQRDPEPNEKGIM